VVAAPRALTQGSMRHPGLVHRRAHQVVHRRVDDAEVLRAGLEVQHLGQQHAGIADQRAAGLEQQLAVAVAARVDALRAAGRPARRRRRRLVGVGDAQAAAEVEVVRWDAAASTASTRSSSAVQRVQVGCDWVICEPMWQSMPTTRSPGSAAARR
jgi:hypothetical protein